MTITPIFYPGHAPHRRPLRSITRAAAANTCWDRLCTHLSPCLPPLFGLTNTSRGWVPSIVVIWTGGCQNKPSVLEDRRTLRGNPLSRPNTTKKHSKPTTTQTPRPSERTLHFRAASVSQSVETLQSFYRFLLLGTEKKKCVFISVYTDKIWTSGNFVKDYKEFFS